MGASPLLLASMRRRLARRHSDGVAGVACKVARVFERVEVFGASPWLRIIWQEASVALRSGWLLSLRSSGSQ